MILASSKRIFAMALGIFMFTGCGITQQTTVPPPGPVGFNADGDASWIRPGAANGPLLYVSSLGSRAVYIFSYPHLQLVGVLGQHGWDQPVGICSDSKGNVFLTLIYDSKIIEYAHGGTKPIVTLSDPDSYPSSCAIDPTTGNLAAAGAGYLNSALYEGVAIYAGAKGKPKIYQDSYFASGGFCGYDNKGNLFEDGSTRSYQSFLLVELAKGAKTFSQITVNQHIDASGGVQWDGKHITVFDFVAGAIYGLKITGSTATVVSSTTLDNSEGGYGTWIEGHQVVVPNEAEGRVDLYDYPAGGDAIKTTTLQAAFSATVSVAPNR